MDLTAELGYTERLTIACNWMDRNNVPHTTRLSIRLAPSGNVEEASVSVNGVPVAIHSRDGLFVSYVKVDTKEDE